MKFLTGITRGGEFIPAEPWTDEDEMAKFGDRLDGLSQRLDQERRAERAVVEARLLVTRLRASGHTIELTGEDNIRVSPAPPPDVSLRLRAAKAEVLLVLRAQAQA